MFSSARLLQGVVICALVIHVAWIVNHLWWVANDRIDPWKLGGYGMYTVPSPGLRLEIQWVSASGRTGNLNPDSYSTRAIQRSINLTNKDRVFRCAPVSPKSLRAFFEENPSLRGVNLAFVFSELRFVRDPVAAKRREQGRVEVQWIGDNDFVYGNSFCGDIETGQVTLS